MKFLKNWNVIAALFLMATSAWLLFLAIPSEIPPHRPPEVSPRFYPNMGAFFLGLFSFLLLCREWHKGMKNDITELPLKRWGREQWELASLIAAIAVYGFLVSLLGFYIMSALLLIGFYRWLGVSNWVRMVFISAICLAFIYLLFEKGLRVELPRFFS